MANLTPVQDDLQAGKPDAAVPPPAVYNVTTYAQLVAALAAANDGDTINLAAGSYVGNLAITRNVTINGANVGTAGNGTRGAESIIDGAVTSNSGVRIDGVSFLNSSSNATAFNALSLSGSANVTVTNSLFLSNGPNGTLDRAITLDSSATGTVIISNNSFGGTATGLFSTANWSSAIWSDGGAAALRILNNNFDYVRTALNLDGFNNAATTISGNQFSNSGSGISIGTPTGTTITGITGNTFTSVGTDFNLRNVTTAQSFDLAATNNTGGGTGAAAQLYVLGSAGADSITGSNGNDILDARDGTSASFFDTAANTLDGGNGDDILIGSRGNDTLIGGGGADLATILPNGGTDTFDGGSGTDTLDLRNVGAVTATASGATTTYSYTGGSVAATSVENILYTGSLTVNGGSTDDIITTGSGNETINAGSGNDTIESGDGNDIVLAGDGNDTVIGGSGAGDDFYDGGAGNDTLTYPSTSQGITVDMNEIDRSANPAVAAILTAAGLPTNTPVGLATGSEIGTDAFRNFENVTGGSGNDVIRGNAAANIINGGDGSDRISGGGGNDRLNGGAGGDVLDYSDITNGVQVNLVSGLVNAGAQGGQDTVSNFEVIVLGSGNDQFIGDENENGIFGGAGDDQIDGGVGFDTFVYVNVAATDGMAQQAFDVLRVNAGAEGTDLIQRVEQIRFVNGVESFDVRVDGSGNALVASRDDAAGMNEGDVSVVRTAATGVLSNDVNIDQGAGDQKVVVAVNGVTGNVGQPIVGTYGTLILNADGSYTYVQNQAATNSLRAGQTVTDTFAYTADDGDTGDSAPANLVFTITGANDLPTLGGQNTGTLTEDTNVEAGTLFTSGTLTVTDPDQMESAYRPQTSNNESGLGTFSLLANGSWTYSVNNSSLAVQRLGAGQSATDSFTARSVDGTAIPVTVTINGVNDNPVIGAVTFADPGIITLPANSANGTLATALVLTGGTLSANPEIYNSTTVPHVTIVASTDGNPDYFTFTFVNTVITQPNNLFTVDVDAVTGTTPLALTFYFNGSELLTTTVDRFGAWPLSPPFDNPSPGTLPSGQIGTQNASALSGTLQVRVGSAASGGTVGLGVGNGYVMHISLPGAALLVPGVLTESNAALSTTGSVAFSDVDLNDSPVASYSSATGFTFNLANGPTLTAAQQTALAAAFSITPAGAFTFTTPSPDFLGHDDVLTLTYNVVVNDQHGGSATTPVTITINGTNDAPVITSAAQGATLTEGTDPARPALSAAGTVTATDIDNGDTVTFSRTSTTTNVSAGVTLTTAQSNALVNAFGINASGAWTYNLASPDFLAAGSTVTLNYTVTASDGRGGTASQVVTIVVNGTNDTPTILVPNAGGTYSPGLTESDAALSASGKVNFTDIDINSTPTATYAAATDASVSATGLTLSAAQIAAIKAGFVLVDAAGNYTFNLASPDYLAAGDVVTATFNVHVVDGRGADTVQPITITITGTNDAPVLTGGSLGSITDTVAQDSFAPMTGNIAGSASDVDIDDTKSFALNGSGVSTYGTLTLNTNGTYSFAANNAAINGLLTGETATVTYSVTVTDSGGLTSTADFTITITGQNDNPVLAVSPLQLFTSDFGGAATFNLLTGASDPDNLEINDFDITNIRTTAYTTTGDLSSGQLALVTNAVANAFTGANYDPESGTISFATSEFDFLDNDQSITVTVSYTITDSNGGSVAQTAEVTIYGELEYNSEGQGSAYDDTITGGIFGDLIFGRDGDDRINGASGSDELYGEYGDDAIDGGSGNDIIVGGEGDDTLSGGSGNDRIYGDDTSLFSNDEGFSIGDNRINGGSGDDQIYGGLGNNVIAAGSGDDEIFIGSAGLSSNEEDGGSFDFSSGLNIVDGGAGFDTVYVSGRWSDYTITRTAANTYVFERSNEDGVESNVYTNVEYFVFNGGRGTAAMLANNAPMVAPTLTFATPEVTLTNGLPFGGRFISSLRVTDADALLGDQLRYFIDGSGAENFAIDEDGGLLLIRPIDYETQPRVYTLALTVVDARGASATSTITVNITNANDPLTEMAFVGNFNIPELAAFGTNAVEALAYDQDGDTVTFSLIDDAGGRFMINAVTGLVQVANGNLLDFEQATSHIIIVRATSSDGSYFDKETTINITDVATETITGTSASETFVAGAGVDSYTTNITTGGADSVNLGGGLDRVTINATAPGQVRLTFTSMEVGNGQANDSDTLPNQDGGLAVRVQAEDGADGLTGPVTRTDDEGMIFVGGAGVTFDVRDLPTGVSRGDMFQVAVLGTSGADTLTAVQNTRPYYFNAGAGNDTVTGGAANDFLVGGSGDDVLAGLGGNNSYIGGAGNDTVSYATAPGAVYADLLSGLTLNGFGGNDVFISGVENLIGSAQNDILLGDNADNVVTGGGGNDYLIGRDGNDTLIGNANAPSQLQGGTGNDLYVVRNAGDSIIEFAGEGIDTVQTALGSYTLRANLENLVYTGTGAFTGVGNALDNSLTGGTGNDTLTGGAGADTFNAIASNGLDRIADFLSGTDRIMLDMSYTRTATIDFVSGAGAQAATGTNSTFLYNTTTGILSYDADGTGSGEAVELFNLGGGTTLVATDLVFPVMP